MAQVRDYKSLQTLKADGTIEQLDSSPADMVMLDLAEDGNYFAVRPSGTEPKVKFYMFVYAPPAESTNLDAAKQKLTARLCSFGERHPRLCESRYRLVLGPTSLANSQSSSSLGKHIQIRVHVVPARGHARIHTTALYVLET